MIDREARLPLLLGFAVAVVVHAGALPLWVAAMQRPEPRPSRVAKLDKAMPSPHAIRLGREGQRVSRVAWISHDALRDLQAPRSVTEQPAIQDLVDPVEQAPIEPRPTPPAQPAAQQRAAAAAAAPAQPRPGATVPPASPAPDPRAAAAPAEAARPTAAAHDRQRVDPTTLDGADLVRVGRVLVAEGIEITTSRPDLGVITGLLAAGGGVEDTTVRIRFNREGQVDEARLLNSTTQEGFDAAVLASLYRWRAEGERLRMADPHITVTIEYRFGGR